jgi:uncharacterized membrane protein
MHPLTAAILADIGGLLLLPVGLFAIAFWIWMIVECARHETGSELVLWLLLILFVGIVGAPLYFFLRRLPRQVAKQNTASFAARLPIYQPWRKDQKMR